MRIDVFTIFPEYLEGPLGASLLGQARAERPARRPRARPARPRDRPPPQRRRHAVRRRRGDGDDARAAVRRGRGRRPAAPAVPARRPAAAASTRRVAARARRRRRASRCCAAATRASTSGSPTTSATASSSVGDYVLAGGEAAALVVIEAVARLVPGVMGNEASAAEESFGDGLLEYPQYTRPAEFRGWDGARGAALGRPRPGRPLAAGAGAAPHPAPGGPTCSSAGALTADDRRCSTSSPSRRRRPLALRAPAPLATAWSSRHEPHRSRRPRASCATTSPTSRPATP